MRRLRDGLGHFFGRGTLGVVIAALGPLAMATGPGPALAAFGQTAVAQALLVTFARTPSEQRRLEDPEVGYSLFYPGGWIADGQVAATEFAVGAQCRSVRIVDFEPPRDAGPGAQILHSFVQVCAKLPSKSAPLDDFMRETYGASLPTLFRMSDLNGTAVYQTKKEGPTKTIFIQTENYRIQIFSSVTADRENYAERRDQIDEILASFSMI